MVTYTARQRRPDDPALNAFMRADKASNLFLIGSVNQAVSPPPHIACAEREGRIVTVLLLHQDVNRSALMASGDPLGLPAALEALPLPRQVAFHLTLKEVDVLSAYYEVEWAAPHLRMIRDRAVGPPPVLPPEVRRLGAGDLPAVWRLALRVAEVSFTETQYRLNPFFGLDGPDGDLLAVGGFHVYNRAMSVAALGSIGVDPQARGRGMGRMLLNALLYEARDLEILGLTVSRENRPALRLYESLGFSTHAHLQGGIATLRGA